MNIIIKAVFISLGLWVLFLLTRWALAAWGITDDIDNRAFRIVVFAVLALIVAVKK